MKAKQGDTRVTRLSLSLGRASILARVSDLKHSVAAYIIRKNPLQKIIEQCVLYRILLGKVRSGHSHGARYSVSLPNVQLVHRDC